MSINERLESFPFFEDFTRDELSQLATFMEDKEFKNGEIIIDEVHSSTSMFFILKGRVKIFRMLTKASNFITILEPTDLFGDVSFVDQQTRSASASACEDVRLAEFSLEHFDVISRQQPQLGIKFLMRLAREITRKFRAVDSGVDVKSSDQTINDLIVSGQEIRISTTSGVDYHCKITYADKSQALPMLKIDVKGQMILVPFNQVKTITLPNKYGKF